VALTPTILIAANGLLGGDGIGTNKKTTDDVSSIQGNPMLAAYRKVSTNTNIGLVPGVSDALNLLPSSFNGSFTTTNNVISQAGLMAPNMKTFITLHSSATSFTNTSMDYGAALNKFSDKSFAEMGIGVKNFTDVTTGGMTSIVPGLGLLADKAKTDAFGGIGASLDPSALAKGQATAASSALDTGLKSISQGLKNFGLLFDFKNPQQGLSYKGLVDSLQKQGLADSVGINDGISAANYDPKNLNAVPDSVLKDVLSGVRGADLQKIITQMNVKPVGTYESAADLIDPTRAMPASAVAALGLKPNAGAEGLKSLGNTMTNIGIPMDNFSTAKLMGSIKAQVGPYMNSLTELVPQSVKSAMAPVLGVGSSPFGTPKIGDLLGSISGAHNTDLDDVNANFNALSTTSVGQALTVAMVNMDIALTTMTDTGTALTNLQNSVTDFNTQASSNSNMILALGGIAAGLVSMNTRLTKETNNFTLAGVTLASPPASPAGSVHVLSFAERMHGYGVDQLQLGHSEVLNGAATDNLAGDAIKSSMIEGRNLAALARAGKVPTTVSSTLDELAAANASNIDSLISEFAAAKTAEQQAETGVNLSSSSASTGTTYTWWKPAARTTANTAATVQSYVFAADAATTAQDNLLAAANNSDPVTAAKADAAIAQFIK
jgi:hypothetical protein